jgi:hypothetical protein
VTTGSPPSSSGPLPFYIRPARPCSRFPHSTARLPRAFHSSHAEPYSRSHGTRVPPHDLVTGAQVPCFTGGGHQIRGVPSPLGQSAVPVPPAGAPAGRRRRGPAGDGGPLGGVGVGGRCRGAAGAGTGLALGVAAPPAGAGPAAAPGPLPAGRAPARRLPPPGRRARQLPRRDGHARRAPGRGPRRAAAVGPDAPSLRCAHAPQVGARPLADRVVRARRGGQGAAASRPAPRRGRHRRRRRQRGGRRGLRLRRCLLRRVLPLRRGVHSARRGHPLLDDLPRTVRHAQPHAPRRHHPVLVHASSHLVGGRSHALDVAREAEVISQEAARLQSRLHARYAAPAARRLRRRHGPGRRGAGGGVPAPGQPGAVHRGRGEQRREGVQGPGQYQSFPAQHSN